MNPAGSEYTSFLLVAPSLILLGSPQETPKQKLSQLLGDILLLKMEVLCS